MSSADSNDGFTLVEIIVALAVLGLFVVAALGVAAADLRASRTAAAHVEAAALAAEILSRIETYTPAELNRLRAGVEDSFEAPMQHYRWRALVADSDDAPGLLDVEVTIFWSGGSLPVRTRLVRGYPAAESR